MTDADPRHEALPLVQFVTARLAERKTDTTRTPERVAAELEAIRKIIANARTALDQASSSAF